MSYLNGSHLITFFVADVCGTEVYSTICELLIVNSTIC